MQASFMDRYGTYLIIGGIALLFFALMMLDFFSPGNWCGYIPAGEGEVTRCRCLGRIDIDIDEVGETYYCKGLNFSNNTVTRWLDEEKGMPVGE